MRRRTYVASLGSLLLAGCASSSDSGSGEPSAQPSETASPTPSPTPDVNPPSPDLQFEYKSKEEAVHVVHYGGDRVTDERTAKVVVTRNGEPAVTWVADEGDDNAHYPLSIGNYVVVSASPGDSLAVVWHSEKGPTATLAEYTVPESTPTPTGTSTSEK